MAAVKHHGTMVRFVEPDMDSVARYVSRILAFYSGEIIADGTPMKVLCDERMQELVIGHHIDPSHILEGAEA